MCFDGQWYGSFSIEVVKAVVYLYTGTFSHYPLMAWCQRVCITTCTCMYTVKCSSLMSMLY